MKRLIVISLTIFLIRVNSFAQQWESFTTQNSGLPSNNVFSIDVDEFGTLWFGTDRGISAYDGFTWYTYTKSDCLADNQVNDFIITSGPELWLATNNGISVMDVSSLDAITMSIPFRGDNAELLSNKINALAVDSNNAIWFGTDSGITVFTGSEWIRAKNQGVVLRNDVVAMDDSPNDLVYCGSEGGGVARLRISNLDVVTGASTIERPWAPVPIDSVYALYIGADSLQWFGTTQGLFQHSGINSKTNWKGFTVTDGLPHRQVQAITEDKTGKIWVGTLSGVSCIAKDLSSCLNYSMSDGLVNNNVRGIAAKTDGSIWFATAGGASRFSTSVSFVKENDTTIAQRFDKIAIYPNPFNSRTSVEFKLMHPAHAEIIIYNLSGQRVRILWNGLVNAGTHVVHWDGLDDDDCIVSTGVYFARFVSGRQVINKKMLVIK